MLAFHVFFVAFFYYLLMFTSHFCRAREFNCGPTVRSRNTRSRSSHANGCSSSSSRTDVRDASITEAMHAKTYTPPQLSSGPCLAVIVYSPPRSILSYKYQCMCCNDLLSELNTNVFFGYLNSHKHWLPEISECAIYISSVLLTDFWCNSADAASCTTVALFRTAEQTNTHTANPNSILKGSLILETSSKKCVTFDSTAEKYWRTDASCIQEKILHADNRCIPSSISSDMICSPSPPTFDASFFKDDLNVVKSPPPYDVFERSCDGLSEVCVVSDHSVVHHERLIPTSSPSLVPVSILKKRSFLALGDVVIGCAVAQSVKHVRFVEGSTSETVNARTSILSCGSSSIVPCALVGFYADFKVGERPSGTLEIGSGIADGVSVADSDSGSDNILSSSFVDCASM
jgi:hypothetical protein